MLKWWNNRGLAIRLNSIRWKILIPMATVMILQALLFSGVILFGGILQKLDANAFDILSGQARNSRDHLEYEMMMHWSAINTAAQDIQDTVNLQMYRAEATPSEFADNPDLSDRMVQTITPRLIELLRANATTGAFVVLGGDGAPPAPGESQQKSCVYLRDTDPTTAVSNNSDLLLSYAPVAVSRKMDIPLDSLWRSRMVFDGGRASQNAYDFYYKPIQAAEQYPNASPRGLGYWSKPFRMEEESTAIITYSMPLKNQQGEVYGVLGIELSLYYLNDMLPIEEMSKQHHGVYWLGVSEGDSFRQVVSRGSFLLGGNSDTQNIRIDNNEVHPSVYRLADDSDYYAVVQYLDLYQSNAPFADEQWALLGIIEKSDLLGFTQSIRNAVAVAFAISLVIGLMGVMMASGMLTKPVVTLINQLHNGSGRQTLRLDKTNIFEIDELTTAMEELSQREIDSASKLTQIVDMAGIPIGAFEYRTDEQTVAFTGRFFEIMQLERPKSRSQAEEAALFRQIMREFSNDLENFLVDKQEHVFERFSPDGEKTWISMRTMNDGPRVIGVVTDVTKQVLERQKIERERDYDHLTGLYSRGAFTRQLTSLFEHPEILKIGAAIMLDLDNLKYINDTFGHDFGDVYLQGTANLLNRNTPTNTLISRMSGDEFYIFYYGYTSIEQLRLQIDRLRISISEATVELPDGQPLRVRISGGIAWYPKDSSTISELLKYADFAMYKVKNTTKGEFCEFSHETYDKESFLLSNNEDFNLFIDEQRVEYHFQPIVDVRTGKPFAYEALMRSTLNTLRSPAQIMALARTQFKLYQIERLTWLKALEQFAILQDKLPEGSKVFINSIANQALNDADMDDLENRFQELLPLIVMEVTEGEQLEETSTNQKKARVEKWHGGLALDDFGTGYNSDVALLSLTPDYVKIDMSIVRNVHIDPDRQTILKNLISYSKERGIKVIAEGVEILEEMDILIRFGVDYIQGFYVGRPEAMPKPLPEKIKQEMVESYLRWH